jgi:hypothetical protein
MTLRAVLVSLFVALFAAASFAQDDPGLEAQLSLGDGKTTYRSGEPITLVLTLKGTVDGYFVSVGREVIDTVQDDVIVSPAAGVFEWKKQYMRGASYTSDAISLTDLSKGPVRVEIPLNDFVRFELPGKYTVRVNTKRVWFGHSMPKNALETNEVSFEVKMMSPADEAAEVARLATMLDKAKGWQEQTRIMTQMSYLTGNAAIPEKVKRFLSPVDSGNYLQAAGYGLYMSKDRRLVIKMLEEVFRDVNRPVNFQLLGALSSLKLLEEVPVPAKPIVQTPFFYEEEPEKRRIRDSYLREIVDTLAKRQGKNLNEAAFLILQNLPRNDPPVDVLAKVRNILISHFEELTLMGQEMLLTSYWDLISDPVLITSLEKLLKDQTFAEYSHSLLRARVLRRLSELDPVRSRPFVIAEIRNPNSMMEDDIVNSLEDRRIFELDEPLVQQIRKLGSADAGHIDNWPLRLRTMFAARFATNAVFYPLLDLYKANAAKWQSDSRAFLISYFSRYDPQQALALLDAEIKSMDKDQTGTFLHNVTRMYYAPELTTYLEQLLASDDARIATTGAYILSLHGPVTSRPKIEARLARWLERWGGHESEIEGPQMKPENNGEAMLEVELILALRDGKNWKLTEADLAKLIVDCKTTICSQHFRPQNYASPDQ